MDLKSHLRWIVGNDHTAMVGKIKVGSAVWNSYREKGSDLCFRAYCTLPGVRNCLGSFRTREEARKAVEDAYAKFIDDFLS